MYFCYNMAWLEQHFVTTINDMFDQTEHVFRFDNLREICKLIPRSIYNVLKLKTRSICC